MSGVSLLAALSNAPAPQRQCPVMVSAIRLLASAAVQSGLVVVSGMARGLDRVAHEAALDQGGGTVGVLGNGLGVIYPAANRALYESVAKEGCLLSEYPPGDKPHAGSFPRRNRLISGLSRVTVVVEARERSGALITAANCQVPEVSRGGRLHCEFPNLTLRPRPYSILIAITDLRVVVDLWDHAAELIVMGGQDEDVQYSITDRDLVYLPHQITVHVSGNKYQHQHIPTSYREARVD